jgi:hypothetical protein
MNNLETYQKMLGALQKMQEHLESLPKKDSETRSVID